MNQMNKLKIIIKIILKMEIINYQ